MKIALPLCLLVLGSTLFAAPHDAAPGARARAAAIPCATRTAEQWQSYLDAQAAQYPEIRWDEVVADLKDCEAELAPGKRLACMGNLYGISRSMAWDLESYHGPLHVMGWNVSDETYLAARPKEAVDLPAALASA